MMKQSAALDLARSGQLYPGVILHGGEREVRLELAVELGRILLCAAEPADRPCGECRHCHRISLPGAQHARFHPDFRLLERDLRTATSVEAVKGLVRTVQMRPFEARGQVLVIADAETLADGAANALLKNLEEPPTSAPRHFMLLAPSAAELLPTLRSRCLQVYLGEAAWRASSPNQDVAEQLRGALDRYRETRSPVLLLAAARVLHDAFTWDDPRSSLPWTLTSSLLLQAAKAEQSGDFRAALLHAAEELFDAVDLRVRRVPALRVLEGTLSRCLSSC